MGVDANSVGPDVTRAHICVNLFIISVNLQSRVDKPDTFRHLYGMWFRMNPLVGLSNVKTSLHHPVSLLDQLLKHNAVPSLTTGPSLLLIAQVQQWAAAPSSTTSTIPPLLPPPPPTMSPQCPPTRPWPTQTAAWRRRALPPPLLQPPAQWAAADDYRLHLVLGWATPPGHIQDHQPDTGP